MRFMGGGGSEHCCCLNSVTGGKNIVVVSHQQTDLFFTTGPTVPMPFVQICTACTDLSTPHTISYPPTRKRSTCPQVSTVLTESTKQTAWLWD